MSMQESLAPPPSRLSAEELRGLIRCLNAGHSLVHYRDREGQLALVPLLAPNEIAIGRQPGSGITLDWDRSVSRIHAILRPLGPDWTIEDEGLSRNGTFVNGGRVTTAHRLENGDAILIGSTPLAYRVPEGASGERTRIVEGHPRLTELAPVQQQILAALCAPVDALHPRRRAGKQPPDRRAARVRHRGCQGAHARSGAPAPGRPAPTGAAALRDGAERIAMGRRIRSRAG